LAYRGDEEETYENLPPPLPTSQPPSYLPPPPPELLAESLAYDLDRTDLDPRPAAGQHAKLSGKAIQLENINIFERLVNIAKPNALF
jgi:hypothetical protein